MTFVSRFDLIVPALFVTLLLAACSTPPPPPAPSPPPPLTTVSLAPRVIEQAASYADYMARAGAVSPMFADAAQVSNTLTLAAASDPQQLRRGAVALAALLALQDPAFVAGVRTYVADPAQRRAVVLELYKDPAYAAGFKGSESAAGHVIAQLAESGLQVYQTGKRVKQAAYDVQNQAWSNLAALNRDDQLARAKALASAPMVASLERITRLQSIVTGTAPASDIVTSASAPYSPLVNRGLTIAALAALGEAGEASQSGIEAIMAEPTTDRCLSLAKLNLFQCLAVAAPNYEDVFCLGQHILMDTGQCMITAIGAAMPMEPLSPPSVPAVKAAGPQATQGRRPAAIKAAIPDKTD